MINKEQFDKLRNVKGENLISIYIPTEVTGDYQKNIIRWKNAIKKADTHLEEKGVHQKDRDDILSSARALLDEQNFWAYQSAGLSGFYGKDVAEVVNLAYSPIERCEVSEEFITYPLLPTLLSKERVFILTLSQKDIRFFEAHEHAIFPVKIDDLVPTSMDELEKLEKQSSLQMHSSGDAQFHGHAASMEKDDVRLAQLFRMVDEGMKPIFRDEQVPLVLAGIKKHQSIYQKLSHYKHIHDKSIDVHPDQSDPVALHTEVLPLFREIQIETVKKMEETYQFKKSKGLAIDGLNAVLHAAKTKNVDTLLIYGSEDSGSIDETLTNEVILSAMDQGANIRFVSKDESEVQGIHATLRFPMTA